VPFFVTSKNVFVMIVAMFSVFVWHTALAAETKPNILIIWGDDIGFWNVSAYNQGMMGYKTPNIDRIAREGALFTDWYGQQSCTAGRASFITGQVGFRTGMLKVGLPGAKEGLQARDVTIAEQRTSLSIPIISRIPSCVSGMRHAACFTAGPNRMARRRSN
jgi:hypothetical protein